MHAVLGNSLRGFAPRLDANGTPRVLTAPFLMSTKNVMLTFSDLEVIGRMLTIILNRQFTFMYNIMYINNLTAVDKATKVEIGQPPFVNQYQTAIITRN